MLGVVAEQTPKGGALTLNAISGIGMLAVGTLGFPYIGALQAEKENQAILSAEQVSDEVPGLVEDGQLTVLQEKSIYEVIKYKTISDDKLDVLLDKLSGDQKEAASEEIANVRRRSSQGALANMTVFPFIMLVGYLLLIVYFRSQGGYEAQVLTGHAAEDEKFTGGVEGAVE
jgi:hypothetical protein